MMPDSPLALVALFPGSINTLQGSYNGRMMPDSPLALVTLSLGLQTLHSADITAE